MPIRAWIACAVLWSCAAMSAVCAAGPATAQPLGSRLSVSSAPAPLPETPRLRRYGVAEGLPSSNVNALAQDADGYLWIASDDGLARFDGVGFRIWRHAPDDPGSLPGNLVQALHVDARGRIWVGIEGQGLAMLEPDGMHFRQYRHANTPAIGEEDVFAIASGNDGAIWFGTFGGGLYRIAGDGRIAHFMPRENDPHSLPDVTVLALAVDAHADRWIATTAGAARWKGHVGSNEDRFERVDALGIAGSMVYGFRAESDGRMWIAGKTGLYLRDAHGVVQPMHWNPNVQDPRITNLLRDRDGGYWLSAPQLLHKRDDVANRAGEKDDVAAPVPALSTRVLGMLEDREGGIWFATQGSGLVQLAPGWRQFATFRHDPQDPASLASTAPDALALADDGRIWAAGGRDAVLDRIDPATGAITHWQPPQLAHKYLWSLSQRRDGPLWVGYNPGLARIDLRSGAVQTWEAGTGTDATLPGPVDLIAQTPDGRVWISSQGGGVQARDADGQVLIGIAPDDGKGLDCGRHRTTWRVAARHVVAGGRAGPAAMERDDAAFGCDCGCADGPCLWVRIFRNRYAMAASARRARTLSLEWPRVDANPARGCGARIASGRGRRLDRRCGRLGLADHPARIAALRPGERAAAQLRRARWVAESGIRQASTAADAIGPCRGQHRRWIGAVQSDPDGADNDGAAAGDRIAQRAPRWARSGAGSACVG